MARAKKSDKQLRRLAEVVPEEDVELARERWKKYAPFEAKELTDAETLPEREDAQ